MLLLVIGFLLPMNTAPICFQYVSGPDTIRELAVEVDSTQIGSYLPTQLRYVGFLHKNGEPYTAPKSFIDGDVVYVTVKEVPLFRSDITLIRGAKLDNRAKYDIRVEGDKRVTFIKRGLCN